MQLKEKITQRLQMNGILETHEHTGIKLEELTIKPKPVMQSANSGGKVGTSIYRNYASQSTNILNCKSLRNLVAKWIPLKTTHYFGNDAIYILSQCPVYI